MKERVRGYSQNYSIEWKAAPWKPKVIYRESPPAPDIPPKEERGIAHLHTISTASHEVKHAVVARDLGQGVDEFSVVPSGNVLGYVKPARIGNTAGFQATAMASSVDSHPKGTGSDVYKAKMLQHAPGGIHWKDAYKVASSIIYGYSEAFLNKLSDLVAFVKKGTGRRFEQLMRRAEWEVKKEQEEKAVVEVPTLGPNVPMQIGRSGDIFRQSGVVGDTNASNDSLIPPKPVDIKLSP